MAETPGELERLAARATAGDRAALRQIYELTADRLVREVIGPIVVERAGCEDVLRDTFIVVIERLPSLATGEVFPWLATIARNKSLDYRRRVSSTSRFGELFATELAVAEAALPDLESTLASAQTRRLARERIDAVLAKMNPRYAEALKLRLLAEESREACAAALGIKLGNFDVLFFRACKQFRGLYVEMYGPKVEVPT